MGARKYNGLLFLFYIPIVIFAKIIRWTILKRTTVDAGIGHHMIQDICNKTSDFFILGVNTNTTVASPATSNAIYIFRLFNWLDLQTYTEFEVAITIVFNILMLWLLHDFCKRIKITKIQLIFLLFFVGVMNIYTFCLSKEPIQMLYFLLIYLILRTNNPEKWRWRMCVAVVLLIVLTTRTYYLLMLAFAIGIKTFYPYIVSKLKGKSWLAFLLFFFAAGVAYYVFMMLCSVMRPEEFEEMVRVRTRESEGTVTDIHAVLPPSNLILFTINYLLTILRMLFPIELLHLGPKYMVYVVYQAMISWMMLYVLLKNYNNRSVSQRISICLYWGFTFCSATFEPDFGSWIRHESVTIPFLLFALVDVESQRIRMKFRRRKRSITI